MGIIKTKGLIISENRMGDFDKMVTILTPSGKIGCAAKGARRPRSQLMSGTQFFCFGEYVIFKGTNSYSINSCDTIEIFYNLRMDLDKLNYATKICKIVDSVTYENQNTYKILQLLSNTLYTISETSKNLELVTSVFAIRLLCLLGFMPRIDKCVNCGENNNIAFFSMADDGFKCSKCGRVDKSAISISNATVEAIRYVILAPAKKVFSFNLAEEYIKEMSLVSEVYLKNKLELQ
ncbi:MAG: DNA repair protein RecO [Clostridia bacterium]|nr:DNA repair protein RecO [Clostridia bacterium]